MSKKKSKKNKNTTDRMTGWDKAKLFGTIVVIIWLGLAANGVELSDEAVVEDGAIVEDIALASMMPSLPSFTVTKPGGVAVTPPKKEHVVGVVGPIRSIPDSLNNYRGRGVTPAQLRTFLATSGTKKLMNLSGDIPGKITADQARTVCAEFKVEYLTSGELNRFAARSGYQEGRGFVRSAASAQRHLAGGNVLVIDRSGNRTGALVGAYLVSVQGFTVEQVIMHNNWEEFAREPGEGVKYLETVVGVTKDK
jgi:hypothetical protein